MFEDALHALATARADGFGAVAVYDSHEPRQAELRALADVFLETYERAGDFWRWAGL